jgi:hypothetical protein
MDGQRDHDEDAAHDTTRGDNVENTGGIDGSSETVAGVVTPDERPESPRRDGDDPGAPVFDPRPDLRGA